jgi:hypothetical protein
MEVADETAALQWRLCEWARWMRSWSPKLGLPGKSAFVSLMRPSLVHEGEGTDERVDVWIMAIMDSSIESLVSEYRKAIYRHYLHMEERNDLTGVAEDALKPIVQRKGLLLL